MAIKERADATAAGPDAPDAPAVSTAKSRVLDAAMRLFGEQGYAATSVAQIEAAAGLRPGSGGLYRHVASKRDLLEQGVRRVLDGPNDVAEALAATQNETDVAPSVRLRAIAEAGLARLDHDRDLSRIMLRDLREFPELAADVRRYEVDGVTAALAAWLGARATVTGADVDAAASVMVSAVSHFWTMTDATGAAPLELGRARFLDALVLMVTSALGLDG
ncbi:TetR/AcrR family transcriptional regulator [Planctomonas sp. JC2975]|uniref:TetR/AcrR family transcriptional regulator n=1 Tax=Planctomonas sp. JC2975 TaxID=2729626 RepID=UPI00147537D1|nr:TetR/AcrR family transcriptional regulator [Planctomonas sp. JC2975]NNC12713.1 TetR/AcrR family transcriptional regulator [Planctomonas sp. JC2975]